MGGSKMAEASFAEYIYRIEFGQPIVLCKLSAKGKKEEKKKFYDLACKNNTTIVFKERAFKLINETDRKDLFSLLFGPSEERQALKAQIDAEFEKRREEDIRVDRMMDKEKGVHYYDIRERKEGTKNWVVSINQYEEFHSLVEILDTMIGGSGENTYFSTFEEAEAYIKQIRKEKKYPYLRKRR
jgi:hypothetical protein